MHVIMFSYARGVEVLAALAVVFNREWINADQHYTRNLQSLSCFYRVYRSRTYHVKLPDLEAVCTPEGPIAVTKIHDHGQNSRSKFL